MNIFRYVLTKQSGPKLINFSISGINKLWIFPTIGLKTWLIPGKEYLDPPPSTLKYWFVKSEFFCRTVL